MFRLLFVLFIIIPIIEIFVLMQVGAVLGIWPTIALVIFTAWLGAKYVRQQGLATLNSVQSKMAQGQVPSDEIVTGVMLLVAGVLLVTPGFVTDFMTTRSTSQQSFQFHSYSHEQSQDDSSQSQESPFQEHIQPPHKGQTLDGEFERKD